ncbi:DUF4269 domain-containing protein [Caldalkalibacillus salinus]|uniref:DUF4269 domain-containing protein n=1 Tax=Caldalkalibacillus salinus TaxID=2803787 RepID=UPI001920DAFF|nr:DUF4269 domain-containing protein [Caldalkalibacillus salinus]
MTNPVFTPINSLRRGNPTQRDAYKVLESLGVMHDFATYNPILCGTIPIGINVDTSDLDIIMEVPKHQFQVFEEKLLEYYADKEDFTIKRTTIRGQSVIKANFCYHGFDFELFGQPQPVQQQYAYLHMVIEHHILKEAPELKSQIINLKKQGLKTEPAFCQVLGLRGDPYERLIEYGRQRGMI